MSSFSLCTNLVFTLLSILIHFSSPNSLSISPICRTHYESSKTYEVKSVIPLGQLIYMVVHDLEVNEHIVHEIIQTDVDLHNSAIYLDFSVPIQMIEKWRFEPLTKGRKIQTAFSGTSVFSGKDIITFILDDQTSIIVTVSTKAVANGSRFAPNISMVLDMNNQGYRFAFESKHWTVEDISSKQARKALVLIDQEQEMIIFRNGTTKEAEDVARWIHLSGFVYRDCLILFADEEVYILRPAYYQIGQGEHFIYDKVQLKNFLKCNQHGQYNKKDKKHDFEYQYESDSWFSQVLLLFLLFIVAVSFYIRSEIVRKRSKPSYTRIYCSKDKY